jgi:RHS repeat-associated protein
MDPARHRAPLSNRASAVLGPKVAKRWLSMFLGLVALCGWPAVSRCLAADIETDLMSRSVSYQYLDDVHQGWVVSPPVSYQYVDDAHQGWVVSPPVSYQYVDDAHQGWVVSAPVSYQYVDGVHQGWVVSPPVSYQYVDNVHQGWVVSPFVSYQYFEWPGDLLPTSLEASAHVSYSYGSGAPNLTVTSPKGGENWTAGGTYSVAWLVTGTPPSPISHFGLDYSLDGGASWLTSTFYAPGSASAGSWSIPATAASSHARVQVIAVDSVGLAVLWGESANDFTVSAPGQNPVATPTADNHAPLSGQQVNFTGSGSTDPAAGCAISSHLWNFGDGTTSTLPNPSHTFFSPSGISTPYTVSLQVTDSCGETGANSLSIYVTGQALGNNPQQAFSKDPVNLATGNYTYNHVDLRMPGRGLPFEFKRFYNSKAPSTGNQPLGFGWTHSYNICLSINSSNSAVIAFGDGHQETYASNGAGGYVSEPGIFNNLASSGGGFTLTTKDRQQYNFNSQGQLTSIADKNSNTVRLGYTGDNLRTVTDTVGRVVTLAYDDNNCLTNISDPIGRTVQFAYDSDTNLASATDLRGGVTQFAYDDLHQMTNAVDPRGNAFVRMVYDAQKRVVSSQKDALLNATTFSYDFVNGVTTVTDALGNVSYNYYDALLRVTRIVDNLGNVQNFEYDTNNNRTKTVDKNGRATCYSYDGNGNVASKTDPLVETTLISYDPQNNPTNRTDALSGVTLFRYDSSGNLTNTLNASGGTNTYAYDPFGEPIHVTDANGNSTTNTYDSFGNLVATLNALGGTNAFTYDVAGRKVSQVDALGRTNLFSYDNADNLIAFANALGATNFFTYDGNNNRLTSTDFDGNTATNIYDQKDRLIITRNPLGGSVTNDYDALDRRVRVWDARGGLTGYGYDAIGNLSAITNAAGGVTRYAYDANGNRTNLIDALGNSTTNVFDPLNRLVSTQDALGHTTASVYDALGRRIQSIDALNRTNSFSYDPMGRLTNLTDAAGGRVTYAYDNVGNHISTTDPNGHTTANVFDALNRLVETTDPDGGVMQLGYDAVGNLISRTDPNGHTTTYLYDANNRRTKVIYPTGTSVTFAYDANGNRTNMTDSLGTTTCSFDALNRLTSVTDCYGNAVSYAYDQNGNRTSIMYPGGKAVAYSYDPMNRLQSVTDWLGNTTTYSYDAGGNLVGAVNPNGTAGAYQYDQANRLIALTNSAGISTIISGYQYTLDAVGNQTQVNQTEQLQTTPLAGQSTNIYDNDNRMVVSEGQTQGFDANGNMISINATNLLAYDFENRLTQTSFAGTTNVYEYDGAGNRMSASRGGAVTRYVLDRASRLTQVLAEADAGGNITAYYIYGLGLISRLDANGKAHYYHYDSRGSAIALTDASGQTTEAYAYDPFGRPINANASTNRFRYLGRHGVMDEQDGLSYIRARYYSAERGRFITKDPRTGRGCGSQGLNRYVYALNNPVRLIDISGRSAQEASGPTLSLATSDSSLLHNYLISPTTSGLAGQMTVSTPAVGPSANGAFFNSAIGIGLAEAGQGAIDFLGGAIEAVPGLTTAAMGIGATATGFGAVPGVIVTASGVALAAPFVAESTIGVIRAVQGLGDIFSGFTGISNPFNNEATDSVLNVGDALSDALP